MKARLRVGARAIRILLIAGMLLTMLPAAAMAQITTGISGTVTNEFTAAEVAGVTVYAENVADNTINTMTTTDVNGFYELDVPPGTYDVTFAAPGYVLEDVESVVVTADAVTDVDVSLVPVAPMLSGTVTDADSMDPLEAVEVEAYAFDAGANDWIYISSVVTNADGDYSFTTENVPEGTYRVGTTQNNYEGVFYQARFYAVPEPVLAVEDADDVVVDWGTPRTGIDIALEPPAPAVELSGRVICAAAQMPMPGTLVSINDGAFTTTTDGNGMYSFADLPAGDHQVTFSRTGFLSQTLPVTIVDGEQTVLDVALVVDPETVGKIVGLVTDASTGEPIDGVIVNVNNGWTSVETTTDGSYGVVVPESTHQLQFSATGYETLTIMVAVGPAEEVRQDVELVPDLTPTTGTLTGTVEDESGTPLAGVGVHINNGSPSTTTNGQGQYTFADLPQGEHLAHFVLAGYESLEQTFTIVAGEVTTLDVTLVEQVLPEDPVDRVWDDNRFSGSVAIAENTFDTDPTTPGVQWGDLRHIIVASGEDRAAADPLAAAGLCGAYDAPLFLVSRTAVTAEVEAAIGDIVDQAAGTVMIHVVGGPVSVPNARITEIQAAVGAGAKLTSERILSSGDRYDLAGAIAVRMVDLLGDPEVVLLANGADPTKFFDALALSPIAAAQGYPILLVSRDDLPDGTVDALDAIAPDPDAIEVIIGGGPATVSTGLEDAFEAVLGDEDVTRWSGDTRYETAIAIANGAVGRGWLNRETVGVAAKLPDALSGGAAVGLEGGVLVLTESTRLTPATRVWLETHAAHIQRVIVFGGPLSVMPSVVDAIEAAATP